MSEPDEELLPPGPWSWTQSGVNPAEVYARESPQPGGTARDAWLREDDGSRGGGLVAADNTVLCWSEGGYGSPEVLGGYDGPVARALASVPQLLEQLADARAESSGWKLHADGYAETLLTLAGVEPADPHVSDATAAGWRVAAELAQLRELRARLAEVAAAWRGQQPVPDGARPGQARGVAEGLRRAADELTRLLDGD